MNYHALIEQPVNYEQIKKMMGDKANMFKMVLYNELANYRDLDSLFQNVQGIFLFLQIESQGAPRVGHWTLLLKRQQDILHFDPYGLSPDQELAITHEQAYLTQLIKSYEGIVTESHIRYQKLRSDVNTCGRWCAVRAKMFQVPDREFKLFIDSIPMRSDDAVTIMTIVDSNF